MKKKKIPRSLKEVFKQIRKPIPKPTIPHKSKKVYNRKKEKRIIEIEEETG